jgi:hypothetical protein
MIERRLATSPLSQKIAHQRYPRCNQLIPDDGRQIRMVRQSGDPACHHLQRLAVDIRREGEPTGLSRNASPAVQLIAGVLFSFLEPVAARDVRLSSSVRPRGPCHKRQVTTG